MTKQIEYCILILALALLLLIVTTIKCKDLKHETEPITVSIMLIKDTHVNKISINEALSSTTTIPEIDAYIPIVVEYILNKQKMFETWRVPVSYLRQHGTKKTFPAIIHYYYIDYIESDIFSYVTVDNVRVKNSHFFETKYYKAINNGKEQTKFR